MLIPRNYQPRWPRQGTQIFFMEQAFNCLWPQRDLLLLSWLPFIVFAFEKKPDWPLNKETKFKKKNGRKGPTLKDTEKWKEKNIVMPNPSTCSNFFDYICIQNYLKPFQICILCGDYSEVLNNGHANLGFWYFFPPCSQKFYLALLSNSMKKFVLPASLFKNQY